MRYLYLDCETWRFRPGRMAPRLVCIAFHDPARAYFPGNHTHLYTDGLAEYPLDLYHREDWRDWLFGRGLAPKTVHHLIADVGTCLRWLAKRGEIDVAPELPAVTVPEYVPNVPTPEQQDALLGAIPWELRGLFLSRGNMGVRPEEALRADVADWHWETDRLKVRGKGARERIVPADEETAAWVREFVNPGDRLRSADAAPRPLFRNPRAQTPDGRWTKASARRVLRAGMKATELYFRPNEALRHGFGTRLANRLLADGYTSTDASRVIMAIMGHTEVKTSNRYVRLATERMERVMRKGRK